MIAISTIIISLSVNPGHYLKNGDVKMNCFYMLINGVQEVHVCWPLERNHSTDILSASPSSEQKEEAQELEL